jgi:hypothetical protein
MKKRRLIGLFVVLAAMVVSANVAVAGNGSPKQVSIVSAMTFNNPNPNTGTFTASGAAADSGLICKSGTVLDTGLLFTGYQGRNGFNVQVRKTFTCDDNSGTFFVKLQVHGEWDGTETFSWVVQGGTGSYGNLRGSGSGSTVPNADPSTGNTNTYTGSLLG